MIKSDLYGALSRGYCSEKNKHKVVDPDLLESIADEILLLYCQNQGALEKKEIEFPYDEWQSLGSKMANYLERKDMLNIHDCKCEDKSTKYHLTICCKGMKNEDGTLNKSDFYKEIEEAINRHSKENGSNTPDWVLAEYLIRCLFTFDACVDMRERYYGRERK